jgi:SRSO17 transposase
MELQELQQLRNSLDEYLSQFEPCIKTRPSRKHLHTYIKGQLSPLERKSVEPIALEAGVAPRTLQEFLSLHRWDEQALAKRHRELIREHHSHPSAIAVIDETSCPKKGDKTVGVQRQYCGATGKIDNCVVTVHLGYVADNFHVPLDADLYLPRSWTEDRQRREEAEIPEEIDFRPKWRIALDLLERSVDEGLVLKWLVADEEYGKADEFRRGVDRSGLRYVVEIPKTIKGWTRKPAVREPQAPRGRGRPFKHASLAPRARKSRAVSDLWRRGGPPWHYFKIKETEKGPVVWRVRESPFFLYEEGLPGEEVRLIVAEQPLTGEVKYFLSNAPWSVDLRELLVVAFSRWHIEQIFSEAKGEVGFDHFEVRKYQALQRHLILSMVSLTFLSEQTGRLKKKNRWWSLAQVRAALLVQLDGDSPERVVRKKLVKVARKIEYYQKRRAEAARSARLRTLACLRALGLDLRRLRRCPLRI